MNTEGDQTNDATLSDRSIDSIMAADTAEETLDRAADAIERRLDQPADLWVYVCDPATERISCVRSTAASSRSSAPMEPAETPVPVWTAFESNTVLGAEERATLVPVADVGVLRIDGPAVPANDWIENLATITVHAVRDRCQIDDQRSRIDRLEDECNQLREFASIVSHDLRNPLSVARANFELAVESGDEEHRRRVRDAHDRIESIVQHTLSLFNDDAIERTTVPLEVLARHAWKSVQTDRATLDIDASQTIEGDPARLRQLLENLFRNAIEHGGSQDGRPITVRVGTVPDGFYVEDDGPGIPEDQHDDVFERGYTNAEDGTGIGLSIVADVAAEHDLEVSITEGIDGGARFEFTDTH